MLFSTHRICLLDICVCALMFLFLITEKPKTADAIEYCLDN